MPLSEQTEPQENTRRGFFTTAIYAMGTIISAALAIPAAAYLLSTAKTGKQNQWADAGDITQLAPNSPVEVTFHRQRVDGWKVLTEKDAAWLVKQPDSTVVAFGPNCTHLGCAYHWEAGLNKFLCPCHNSMFSSDGKVLSGPAPRPLDRYQTRVEGSKLLIGQLQRSGEQQG